MDLYSQIHNFRSKHLLGKVVKQSCIFHGGLQLSCWKFSLNQIASWWKSWEKIGKNKKIFILRKILSYEKFSMFWHILMNYDPWHLILTKKSKFDFSVYSWFLGQLIGKFICQSNAFEIFWTLWLGQDDAIEYLNPWLNPIFHWLG